MLIFPLMRGLSFSESSNMNEKISELRSEKGDDEWY